MAFSFMPEAGKPAGDPESLEKRRLMAELMLRRGGDTSPVQHPLQAAARMVGGLTNALAYRNADKKLSEARQSGADASSAAFASLLSGGNKTQPVDMTGNQGNQDSAGLKNSLVQTAEEIGIDPIDLATAVSYETAGTFDPWKKGPTTKWGEHRGLIQWGEPQREKYGVYEGQPVDEQVRAAGKYLQDAGVKPGMGLMDVYSAINTGRVGNYGLSDAAAGGAPGTVADKVNNQMGGHRQKAMALIGGDAGMLPAGTVDASVSPQPIAPLPMPNEQTYGMPTPSGGALNAPASMGQQPMNRTQAIQALEARGMSRDQADAYAGGFMTSPAARGGMPPQPPQPANNLPMQRDGGPSAGMTGDPRNRPVGVQAGFMDGGLVDQVTPQRQAVAGALRGGQSGGMPPEIQAALSNPAVPPETKRMLMAEMLRRNAPADPMKQLQMQKLQAEVDKMQQPGAPKLYDLFDEKTGQPYKAEYNQQTGKYERVGGVKAPSGTKLVVGPDGEITFAQGSGVTGGADATKGSTKVDQEYAEDYVAWTTGGAADAQKQLDQLKGARESLVGKDNISGPFAGSLPDIVSAVVNPDAIKTREAVEEVVQRNLRSVLGAQFTEKEGERLIKRAFNPQLEEPENLKRLDRLVAQIEAGIQAKNSAAEYFAANQTLSGWSGKLITSKDLDAAIDGNMPDSVSLPEGVTEEDIEHTMKLHGVTREQVLERLLNAN